MDEEISTNCGSEPLLEISIIRVVNSFYPTIGGSVTHIIELTKKMQQSIKRQIIIAPSSGKSFEEFDKSFCVPVIRIRSCYFPETTPLPGLKLINLLIYAILALKNIYKLKSNGYPVDLIHVHSIQLGIFMTVLVKSLRLKIPVVTMQHGSAISSANGVSLVSLIMKYLNIFLISIFRLDYYIRLNDGTINDEFLCMLDRKNIPYKIVNHAIDVDYYKYSEEKKLNRDFVILSNHRLDVFKRIDLLILTIKELSELVGNNANFKLIILGSGNLLEELKNQVRQLSLTDIVVFEGEKDIEETRNKIASADVVVGTSMISNVNRSIQEAMSCCKPVVIFGDANNDLFMNMSNSIVVPFGDIKRFADMLKLLLEDKILRENIGKNARKTIVQRRSWNARIKEELDIYIKVLCIK